MEDKRKPTEAAQDTQLGSAEDHTSSAEAGEAKKKSSDNQSASESENKRRVSGEVAEFAFYKSRVRTVVSQGNPWFVAADVCAVLGHSDPSKAISRLDADERGVTNVRTPGGPQTVNVINESGLYALVITSRKPEAKKFRHWVTSEVLPALYHTGVYSMHGHAGAASGHSAGSVTISLNADELARYIILIVPNQPPHVRRTEVLQMIDEMNVLETDILCHSLKTIGCWWERAQELRSMGHDPLGSRVMARLERSIRDGSTLAEEQLRLMHPAGKA